MNKVRVNFIIIDKFHNFFNMKSEILFLAEVSQAILPLSF